MHSFVSCLMHCVWSTKERRRLVTPELQERLYPYLGGIARENKMKALAVGGVEDHVHMLLSVPSTLSIAKAMQLLKGNSSKWIHETFPDKGLLEWQACLHQESETASSFAFIQGRTDCVSRQAWHRIRGLDA